MKFEIPLSYGHTVLILAVTQEDVSKIPFKNSNFNIACQNRIPLTKTERDGFGIQIVTFARLKKAPKIAEIDSS
jgi:hypothetical protein